ncbi:SH2 domain-containing protein 3C-like [Hyalella azteca]|uniref:SH2 domain-containing protein 3C-like n=1 Tax=Hyalella azteca TaxID=294128 RepID=A0A979FNE9_HYAAZ|nr:SH2 domain-containing protein 3C-like [Hyalella azteca]
MGNRWGSQKTQSAAAAAAAVKEKEDKESKVRPRGWSISSLRRSKRASLRRMSWIPRPHLDAASWLAALELPQYGPYFSHYTGVEDFLYFEEGDIEKLGVTCGAHRTRIMKSLRALRDKYEKNHKLKGVDPKPRISLVEDPDNHFSVIHTPLPPTPCSTSTPISSNNNSTLYSSARKNSHRKSHEPLYSPVKSSSCADPYKKNFASADSLLNDSSSLCRNNTDYLVDTTNTRTSNLSINNRYNSPSLQVTSSTGHGKSFSSNPNILSDSGSLAPTNSPISPSYQTRSHSIQPLQSQDSDIRVRHFSRHNSISHYPSENICKSPQNPVVNGHTPVSDRNGFPIQKTSGQPSPVTDSSSFSNFSRSSSTRAHFSPTSTPAVCGRASELSSYASQQPGDGQPVRLRDQPSNQRQNHRKRSAGVLSPAAIAKMSFNCDSGLSLDATSDELSHLLEWELSLDSTDLRSHAWYHGNIPRARAEEVQKASLHHWWNLRTQVRYEEDLLMNDWFVPPRARFFNRDCTTQPGNYVLSCLWDSKVLHFVIQMTIVQPDTVYERIQYELEDEGYDTIPDLICAYVGNKKIVTQATGAKILAPVNRCKPLTYYESLYKKEPLLAAECSTIDGSRSSLPPSKPAIHSVSRTYDNRQTPALPAASDGVSCSIVRSSLGDTHCQRRASQEGVLSDERSNSSDGIIGQRQKKDLAASTQSLPRRIHAGKTELSLPPSSSLTPAESGTEIHNAPPKPSRIPSFKVKARKPPIHVSDRVYAEIDEKEEGSENAGASKQSEGHHGSPGNALNSEQNPRFSRLSEVYNPSGSDSGNGSGDSIQTTVSDARNRDSQSSLVLDGGIAPIEDDSLAEDTPLFSVPEMNPPSFYNLEKFSTFLLPHGENPPLDATALNGIKNTIMDYTRKCCRRTECMRLLVAVTVLKEEDIRVRAELIHRWIQIAIDTKTATGNLYGFNNIMLGLCNPQIQRLTATWHMVRQKFTDSAFSFESKLRSTLKAMNECNNPQAPNTIIPHILPFILLCERDLEDIYSLRRKDESLVQWESATSDYGLQMMLLHLLDGRSFAQNLMMYRRNADLILEDPETLEDLVLDVFRTEFHLKFLFGSRGALRDAQERHAKFQQILSALSSHCESAIESSV